MRLIWLICFLSPLVYANDMQDNVLKACFYIDAPQSTLSLCLAAGEQASWLANPEWNDKIESVTVPEGLEVTLYKNDHFNPPSVKITSDTDLAGLRELGMERAVSSVKVGAVLQVCLYEDAKYQGVEKCLRAGESIVWSEQDYLNKKISSIRVPQGLNAIIYRAEGDNEEIYTVSENMDIVQLNALQMQDDISRVMVSNIVPASCLYLCAIYQRYVLPLTASFAKVGDDVSIPYKYIALDFNRDITQNFTVTLSPQVQIEVNSRAAILVSKEYRIEHLLSPNAKNFSIMAVINQEMKMLELQFLESNGNNYISSSPIFALWAIEKTEQQEQLVVNNHYPDKPLILHQIILAASLNAIRLQRNINGGKVLCFLSPVIAIYNYLIQGQCNQPNNFVDTLYDYLSRNDESTLLHIAGRGKPLPPVANAAALSEDPLTLTLTSLNSRHDMAPLSVYSAARVCNVPIRYVFSSRKKHDADSNDCIYWTLDIITLYTLLFGGGLDTGWNREHFGQMIDNILHLDTTGYAVSDPVLEQELITAVKEQTEALSDAGLRSKNAFDYAQLAWADYVLDNVVDEANDITPTGSPQRHDVNLQEIQTTYALGDYRLNVDEYTSNPIVPRILEQGQWIAHPEQQFEVEIVQAENSENTATLLNTVQQWEQRYRARENSHTDLFTAINIVIRYLKGELLFPDRPSFGERLYFIVRLKGSNEPLSILAAHVNPTRILLTESLSSPENVLTPYAEGAIRGAGAFAVASLAQYAQDQGIKFIDSEVISQPSAAVKKKIGFMLRE